MTTTKTSTQDLLYINGVVQPYTPTPPDPAQVLLYNEVACIGHKDNVTLHHSEIEGWTTIKTPTEIQDAYEEFLSINYTPLLDGAGFFLIDEDGKYLIMEEG